MSAQLVRLDGVLGVVAKAAERDPDAAAELWRLTLFEALADLTETYAPLLRRDIAKAAARRAEVAKAALVRAYIGKRLDGEPVGDVVGAAARLTLIEIAKDESAETRRAAQAKEPRAHGRWTRRGHTALDAIATFTRKPDEESASDLQRFIRPGNDTDRRIYRQVGMVGGALGASGALSGQPQVALLGHAASLVGELGPQAEQILGPGLKRTAYRYRGTEKRPNRQLQVVSRSLNIKLDRLAAAERANPEQAMTLRRSYAAGHDVLAGVLSQRGADQLSVDQLRLQTQAALVGTQLSAAIPDLDSARLSLASGKMPPSRGFIIDADGDIVSEAAGVDGDHYLPFDLKNLRRLHGGAYVRTRATGGPTDEDIYTGLLTGARQLTVISHSGVFTVEFDPDLRGGRRYSDKARAMVGRYSKLLSAVGSGQVLHTDLPPAQIAAERAEFARKHPSLSGDARQKAWDDHLDRLRSERQFAGQDLLDLSPDEMLEAADVAARREMKGQASSTQTTEQRRQDIYDDMLRRQREQTVRAYKLDGDGYKAALDALRTEFPLFVRNVTVTPLPTWLNRQGVNTEGMKPYRGVDIGRTRRGGLAPVSVEAKQKKAAADKQEAKDAAARGEAAAAGVASSTGEQQPAAPAAAAASSTAAPWIEDGTQPLKAAYASSKSDFARELGFNLKRALGLADDPLVADLFSFDANDADEANAATKPDAFVEWAKGKPNSEVAAWVLEDPRRIDTVEKYVRTVNSKFRDDTLEANGVPELTSQLEAAKSIAQPLTKPDGDPILTVPDDGRPVEIPEISALGDRMGNYTRYLDAHPDVNAALTQLSAAGEQAGDEVTRAVSEYKELARWHREGLTPEAQGRAPDNVDAAQQIGELGTNSEQYAQLAALQKAYVLLVQRQTLAAVTGKTIPQDGEAAPKVAKRWSSRGRVIVHPPGSPVSVALAKRQASRSPRPRR